MKSKINFRASYSQRTRPIFHMALDRCIASAAESLWLADEAKRKRWVKRTWGEMLAGYVGMKGTNILVLWSSILYWVSTTAQVVLQPALTEQQEQSHADAFGRVVSAGWVNSARLQERSSGVPSMRLCCDAMYSDSVRAGLNWAITAPPCDGGRPERDHGPRHLCGKPSFHQPVKLRQAARADRGDALIPLNNNRSRRIGPPTRENRCFLQYKVHRA